MGKKEKFLKVNLSGKGKILPRKTTENI